MEKEPHHPPRVGLDRIVPEVATLMCGTEVLISFQQRFLLGIPKSRNN